MAIVQLCGGGRAGLGQAATVDCCARRGAVDQGLAAGSGLGGSGAQGSTRHRQWVALGSVAVGIRAVEAAQAQGTRGRLMAGAAQRGYEWCGMKMSGGPLFIKPLGG